LICIKSTSKDGISQHFYGQFHVFHRKIDGVWKIAVDYDSDEDGTVDETDFEAGLPMDVFENY
jgi:ketosteroid isomerase-like protein